MLPCGKPEGLIYKPNSLKIQGLLGYSRVNLFYIFPLIYVQYKNDSNSISHVANNILKIDL